jgi:circadian clock protein KaiC
VLEGDFDAVLARITAEVERLRPSVVVLDSFRWIDVDDAGRAGRARARDWRTDPERPRAMALEEFVQRLALQLTTWEVTSFLLGEYAESDLQHQLFTVADGILWLTQAEDRNSVVRKLQVSKMRGRAHMPGLHTFRMTDAGVQVFPRIPEQQENRAPTRPRSATRLSTGVPGLDALMGGGIPAGDAVLGAGPTGRGKTTLGMQCSSRGPARARVPVVVAVVEEYPRYYLPRLDDARRGR